VFELIRLPEWPSVLGEGRVRALQWFVYYNDVTAMKAVLEAGGDLTSIDLDDELGNAAFFGHWKMTDFLLAHGASATASNTETGETALHNALAKAGRPYFIYVVKLLVEHGADVSASTIPGKETGAFMRDVRTKGETPLHRAAAYADVDIIEYLLANGADRTARDAHGDSPISWASQHLRPGAVLSLLSFGEHRIGANSQRHINSDHGAGWGNGMDWKLIGEFLPESIEPQ
jgi:ankyrin repeat protein